MSEEQVTRAILKWLMERGWTILDYDFPGGGTGRKFHVGDIADSKTKGIVTPDIIAIRDKTIIVFENKAVDTLSDYDKVARLREDKEFLGLLRNAYPDEYVECVTWGIGYSGAAKHREQAGLCGLDIVVCVKESPDDGNASCSIVYCNPDFRWEN